MRTRIPGRLWYPKPITRDKNKLEATPLVSGNIRVNGSVVSPAQAIEMVVDIRTIKVAKTIKQNIHEQTSLPM
jgi:hypothetical protein